MKKNAVLTFFIVINVFTCFAQKNSDNYQTIKIADSIAKAIYVDTLKFNEKDIKLYSYGHVNQMDYSKLYIINDQYFFRLDIINSQAVKEFVETFLNQNQVKGIRFYDHKSPEAIYGAYANNGVVLINLDCKIKRKKMPLSLRQVELEYLRKNGPHLMPDQKIIN